jgi:hypothetical protein
LARYTGLEKALHGWFPSKRYKITNKTMSSISYIVTRLLFFTRTKNTIPFNFCQLRTNGEQTAHRVKYEKVYQGDSWRIFESSPGLAPQADFPHSTGNRNIADCHVSLGRDTCTQKRHDCQITTTEFCHLCRIECSPFPVSAQYLTFLSVTQSLADKVIHNSSEILFILNHSVCLLNRLR